MMTRIVIDNGKIGVIPLGSKKEVRAILIHYEIVRKTNYESGRIKITNKFTSADLSNSFTGDDCGVVFTSSLNSSTIFLIVTADSSGGVVKFKYEIS